MNEKRITFLIHNFDAMRRELFTSISSLHHFMGITTHALAFRGKLCHSRGAGSAEIELWR